MISTFAASLAAGCGGSPGANPDARPITYDGPPPPPPDAGSEAGYCDPEIQECVDLGADVYVPPDTDATVTRPDGRPDVGPDSGPDAGPDSGPDAGIPGVNYCAAELPGPVKVLKSDPNVGPDAGPDAGPDGGPDAGIPITLLKVWAFTGPDGTTKPIKLSLCTPADPGFDCSLKADFTDPDATSRSVFAAGMVPVDFAPVPDNGFGFAVAKAAGGAPTTVARVDQNAGTPAGAIPGSRYHTSFGTWWESTATHPNSMIAYRAGVPSPAHFRSALTFSEGIIGIFVEDVNFSGEVTNPLRRTSLPGLSDGVNSSSIALTRLQIDTEETDALLVLNSGADDLTTGASISYLDPWATELVAPLTEPADLGLRHAPIFKLAEDGTTAYIAFDMPIGDKLLSRYDLETQSELATIPFDGAVAGNITTMDVSSSRACIGDSEGRLVFVDLDEETTEGYIEWPESPASILWHGGRGTFLVGNGNCIGEVNPPADVITRP